MPIRPPASEKTTGPDGVGQNVLPKIQLVEATDGENGAQKSRPVAVVAPSEQKSIPDDRSMPPYSTILMNGKSMEPPTTTMRGDTSLKQGTMTDIVRGDEESSKDKGQRKSKNEKSERKEKKKRKTSLVAFTEPVEREPSSDVVVVDASLDQNDSKMHRKHRKHSDKSGKRERSKSKENGSHETDNGHNAIAPEDPGESPKHHRKHRSKDNGQDTDLGNNAVAPEELVELSKRHRKHRSKDKSKKRDRKNHNSEANEDELAMDKTESSVKYHDNAVGCSDVNPLFQHKPSEHIKTQDFSNEMKLEDVN